MKIIDAVWTSHVNLYVIQCDCGVKFKARTDRWRMTCPKCQKSASTQELRDKDGMPSSKPETMLEDPT